MWDEATREKVGKKSEERIKGQNLKSFGKLGQKISITKDKK